MATGGDKSTKKAKEAELLDIEEIVERWAWENYDDVASSKQQRLRKKHDKLVKKGQACLELVIDWTAVKFVDTTHWPRFTETDHDHGDTPNANVKLNGLHSVSDASTDLDKQVNKPSGGKPDVNVLFRTTFTNNTAKDQKYTLRTEKTTRSVCETTIEQGYTKGTEFSLTLKAPGEVMEANAGFHSELSLNKSEGQSLEEEVTWGVESEINVEKGHCADATLVVLERKYDDEFTIETRISGHVYARFTNLLENNCAVKMSQRSVDKIVKDYLADRKERNKPVSEQFIKIDGTTVVINTKGTCKFRYGVKQDVRVDQRLIQNDQEQQRLPQNQE